MQEILQSWLKEKNNYLLRIIGVDNAVDYTGLIRHVCENALIFENEVKIDSTDDYLGQRVRNILGHMSIENFSDGTAANALASRGFFHYIEKPVDVISAKNALSKTLDLYCKNKLSASSLPNEAKVNTAISFAAYLISAIKTYVRVINGRKAVFLGDFKAVEAYFINFMSFAGYKTVYFNGKNDLSVYDDSSKLYIYEKRILTRYFIPPSEDEKYDNIKSELLKSDDIFYDYLNIFDKSTDISEHNGYRVIPHFFYRLTGVPDTSELELYNYFNKFVELKESHQENQGFRFIDFSKEANKLTLNGTHKNAIKSLIKQIKPENVYDFSELTEQADKCGLDADIRVRAFFRKALLKTLNLFAKYVSSHEDMNIFMVILEHVNTLFYLISKDIDRINNILTKKNFVLCYGDINEIGAFYIYFLSLIGFNILYFSMDKNVSAIFNEIESSEVLSYSLEKAYSLPNMPFPEQKLISRSTMAYSASEQIDGILFNDTTCVYRPFQFDGYQICNICLKTTYDEISILSNEEARIRPNFAIDKNNIYIPNIFAKVIGVPNDRRTYLYEITRVASGNNTVFMQTKRQNQFYNKPIFSYSKWVNIYDTRTGLVDISKLMNSSLYKYNHIKISAQKEIVDKTNILLKSSDIFTFDIDNEKKQRILNICLGMINPKVPEMLHSFNYYADIPKIVIFNNIVPDTDTVLNLSIFLAFVSLLGFDAIVYCPTGYVDIERYLQKNVYVGHTLPNIDTKIEFKRVETKSSKWFGLF